MGIVDDINDDNYLAYITHVLFQKCQLHWTETPTASKENGGSHHICNHAHFHERFLCVGDI